MTHSWLSHAFRNPALLEEALTHPSTGRPKHYERLELLGDTVLALLVTEKLLALYPGEAEGDIVKRRAALVNGSMLAEIAAEIGLGTHLILSESERQSGGHTTASNLENAMEALIGAVYEDGGLEAARHFVLAQFEARMRAMKTPPKDAKTALQEWAQARGKPLPEYRVVERTGPSHAPVFTVEVLVEGLAPASAESSTKRLAERLAAEKLLEQLPL